MLATRGQSENLSRSSTKGIPHTIIDMDNYHIVFVNVNYIKIE